MDSATSIPTLTINDLELDPATIQFCIGRIENLSSAVLRRGLSAHRIDYYQILWVTGGRGKGWIDFDSYSVQPNTMCFISPNQIHYWEIESSPTGFLIGFTIEFFSGNPDDAGTLFHLPYFHRVGSIPVLQVDTEHADLFTMVCVRLEREMELAQLGQAALLHSLLRILLVEARRLHDAQPGVIPVEETSFALTKQFIQLVEEHYLDASSVTDYAAMLHVTSNHLIETVRRNVGHPAGMIIRERLLLEAKRLLRYSDTPVAEIATRLNFEDPSYFARFFKKKTGISPTEFREQP